MFRTAELNQKLSKKEYKKIEPVLRQELLDLQRELLDQGHSSVIVVFAGVDGGGKGASVNVLNAWMDARWLINRAYREPSEEERERPEFWRYWRDLPPKGQIGLFLSSWYSWPLLDRAYDKISTPELDERLDRILAFENALVDDGALILKFWMHLSRDAQKDRFKTLEKDPLLRWQATQKDWEHWHMYDKFTAAAERIIMRTNIGKSPWTIVEGVDANYRSATVGSVIRDALQKHLQADIEENTEVPALKNGANATTPVVPGKNILAQLDLSLSLGKSEYKKKLKLYQATLNLLHQTAMKKGISTIVVFEGPDAAGKGGSIRRVIGALDAHNYHVLPFAAPTDEERAHHYLWRFWRRLSRAGLVTIFDRSWYGRVLVERVEGYASEPEWRRAYAEINDFEEQLIDHGIIMLKFWIHIDKDEQLRRFKLREDTPYKSWKLTDDDWRNREKWDDYMQAAHDMVEYTSTRSSPWVLIEGNDKHYARIKVLETLCHNLEQGVQGKNNHNNDKSKNAKQGS
jgi:polyphosphate:AMP phosphotransferase